MVFSGPVDPTNRMFFFSVMAARAISLRENYRSRMVPTGPLPQPVFWGCPYE
jgi:hypothetical protein